MEEKELIFLGAVILLAPTLQRSTIDSLNASDIEMAVKQSRRLLAEVKPKGGKLAVAAKAISKAKE